MAVPKKRTGHSAQGKRRANWKATKPEITTCKNCGATVLTHTVCTSCGYYKGKPVSKKVAMPKVDEKPIKEEVIAEEIKEVKEEKKPAKTAKKSTTKKAEKTEVKTEKKEVKTEKKAKKAKTENKVSEE